jgi:hypothetical protein
MQAQALPYVACGELDHQGTERETDVSSGRSYGYDFDALATRWAIIENEHDRHHPDRNECGGVGGCSMMFAANRLESEMVDALKEWRKEAIL